jgi:hypothetical protein
MIYHYLVASVNMLPSGKCLRCNTHVAIVLVLTGQAFELQVDLSIRS